MKGNKRLLSFITAFAMAACITSGTMADPAVYDATFSSGEGFSIADDGITVRTRIYPSDKIANTEIYLGVDNLNAGSPEGMSDVLDNGTPCWVNHTGRVYSVSSYPVEAGIQTDEAGEAVYDEAGNPVSITETKYVLDTFGGTVEVAYGSSGTDAVDPNTGSSAKDSGYFLRGDQAYYYTDAAGTPQTVYGSDVDAAAYPNGTSVWLAYNTPSDPSSVFERWSVYKVQSDGSLAGVPDDQIGQLGVSGLSGADQLKADAVNASGGRLYITVNGMNDRLMFIPVFGTVSQEPEADPNSPDLAGLEKQGDLFGEDEGFLDAEFNSDLIDAEISADDGNLIDQPEPGMDVQVQEEQIAEETVQAEQAVEEPVPDSHAYEVYVDYIDTEWYGPATGYYMYTGGDFSAEIATAQNNPEGLVFSGWAADDDSIIIEGAENTQAVLRFDSSQPMTENKVIRVQATYVQPEPETVRSSLTVIDGSVDSDLDPSQVEEGTEVAVSAFEKNGMVFAGWFADGIELDADQLSAASFTFLMPANAVTLTAQYRMKETEPAVQQTEAPVVQQAEEAPVETLTAQNATINKEDVIDNGDGTISVKVPQGEKVSVTANEAPQGQEFELWLVSTDGSVEVSDISSETVEVTVQDADVMLEPVYVDALDDEDVEQENGQNSAEGQIAGQTAAEVQGTVQAPEAGVNESQTSADTQTEAPKSAEGQEPQTEAPKIAEGQEPQTEAPKPAEQQTVQTEAPKPAEGQTVQTEAPKSEEDKISGQDDEKPEEVKPVEYTLTVVSGKADKTALQEGGTATLTANAPSAGYEFSSWTVSGSGSVANTASAQTTFTMGAGNATVTANYVPLTYTLTVKNGNGSGEYANGEKVSLQANYPESGKEFDSWVTTKGNVSYNDAYSYYAKLTMSASDATVKATYRNGPNPNDNAITGLENNKEYLKSTTLSFTAVGAGMEKAGKNPGDYRYKPSGYQIGGVTGSWSSSPYTTSMAINAAGDYTLTVTFVKEVFDGANWTSDGTTVTKSITFHVVSAMSVNTGDSSPLIPLAVAGIAALAIIIALIVILIKRRR